MQESRLIGVLFTAAAQVSKVHVSCILYLVSCILYLGYDIL